METNSKMNSGSGRIIFIILVLAISLTSIAVEPESDKEDGSKRDFLRVGITPNYPPIIFKEEGVISGMEADFANALARHLEKSVLFIELNWEEQIPALLENKIDIIMSGMSKTKEREKEIAFIVPYYRFGQLPLVRHASFNKYNTWRSIFFIDGKVGVEKGTTGAVLVENEMLKAEMVSFSSANDAVQALINKQVAMVIHDAPYVHWIAKEQSSHGIEALSFSPLSEELLAWGVRKDNNELLNKTNSFLEEWENRGEFERVIKKWIPKN